MEKSQAVVVVATVVPAPGRDEDVHAALVKAVTATHEQDAGCLLYAIHRSTRGKEGFVMIEKWESAEALRSHAAGEAFRELSASLDGLLAEPLGVTLMEPLPAGSADQGQL